MVMMDSRHRARCDFVVEPLPRGFSLGAAVCSYGFAMLAPNEWRPFKPSTSKAPTAETDDARVGAASRSKRARNGKLLAYPRLLRLRKPAVGADGEFERSLRCADGRPVRVLIRQASARRLEVRVRPVPGARKRKTSNSDIEALRRQIVRMLRLQPTDAKIAAQFSQRSRDLASRGPIGRLFRSPSLFEDIVKTFTLCNCGWGRTISMNEALCAKVGKGGAFPTAAELARCSSAWLRKSCKVGYRAERILRLARLVTSGKLDLDEFSIARDAEQAWENCAGIYGLGPFGAANLMQLLGHYEIIPADSETVRHLQQAHGLRSCTLGNVREAAAKVYKKHSPYQFLRYWTELWQTYEDRMGALASQAPADSYRLLTAVQMRSARQPYARNRRISTNSSKGSGARALPETSGSAKTPRRRAP